MKGACIFCEILAKRSLAPYWVAESERAFAFLDIHPLRVGHTLVIPKAHTVDLSDVSPSDWAAVTELTSEVAKLLRRRLGTSGENLMVASGPGSEQSIFHLHVHVIPRKPGDDLRWNDWWETKAFTPSAEELAALARRIRG